MEKQVENFNKVAESLEHLLNLPELVHSVNTSLGLQCILQQHANNNQTFSKVMYEFSILYILDKYREQE